MNNLPRLAELLRARNTVESNIANLIEQPVNIESVGDYIASVIFGIAHEKSPTQKAIYGRFLYGPHAGQSVDVQWHIRREGDLSLRTDPPADYYLVFTGPKASANATNSLVNPWVIESVYFFDAKELLAAGLDEHGAEVEQLIVERPTVQDAEQWAEHAGLDGVTSWTNIEEFDFESGEQFFNSPLITDFLLPTWIQSVPKASRKKVMKELARIIDEERHSGEFSLTLKATLVIGRKGGA